MFGQMVVDMKETGRTIICMVGEFILGKMADVMKVSIRTIESMDLVHIPGQMEDNMSGNG